MWITKTFNRYLALFLFCLFLPFFILAEEPCLECHSEKNLGKNGRSLFIDSTIFNSSIHGDFSCIDCHRDAEGEPHDKELLHVDCSFCHDDVKELYSTGIHGIALQNGDEDAPGCQNCHGSHNIFPSTYPASTTYFSTLQYTCGACHRAEGVAASHDIKIARPVEKYIRGIHSQAVEAGIDTAPTCNDCHESHDLLPSSDSRSRIHYTNISATCGRCHNDIQKDYESSSHGRALVQGSPEAPTCIHCHGEHDIQASYEPSAPISTKRLAQETCGPCHSKYNKLNKKYGLRRNPVESYYQSYHGLATAGGSINAAKCTSCHAKHKILPKTDPQSFIFPGNLEKTCGQCHEGSTENFSKSYIHTRPLSSEERLENIVKNVYIIIIVLVIGGMVVHNSIIMIYYIRQKYHMLKAARTIQRFNKQWIIQHILLIVTFFTLVFTGFGIKFADTAPMLFLTQLGIGVTVRGALHRIAAVILIGTGLYHLYYLFIHREGKGELNHLFFQKKDSLHLVENMKFFIQKSNKKPRFSRYGYIEKVEYWAMVWGTLIMAMTGAVLWFPEAATKFFPSWIIKVAETIHYWEAVLATLSIITYHFFFVIFHPEHYPLNLTFLTGNMTREQARSHFPDWDTKD